MGLFDDIEVHMRCPYCGKDRSFYAQTKQLGRNMNVYSALPDDWFTSSFGKKFRQGLILRPRFPYDIESVVWKNQAERTEAQARLEKKYHNLKYVEAITDCDSLSCQFDADRRDILEQGTPSGFGRCFSGKIAIKDGYLQGVIYDIVLDDLTEEKLEKYKTVNERNKKIFEKLIKKYKHEPILCKKWRIHDEGED